MPDFSTSVARTRFLTRRGFNQLFIPNLVPMREVKLPHLRWVTSEQFAVSRFFLYDPKAVVRAKIARSPFNKKSSNVQAYAYVYEDMNGTIIGTDFVQSARERRVFYGTFAFCEHKDRVEGRTRDMRTWRCKSCGYSNSLPTGD